MQETKALSHSYIKENEQAKLARLAPFHKEIILPIKRQYKKVLTEFHPEIFDILFKNKDRLALKTEDFVTSLTYLTTKTEAKAFASKVIELWICHNVDIFQFFETELLKLTDDYRQLESIENDVAVGIIERGTKLFGLPKIAIFTLFNEVVFSDEIYDQMLKA